jgi:hypothetical protein
MSAKTHTVITLCSAWSVHAVMHKWQHPARESGKSLPPGRIFTGTWPVRHNTASNSFPRIWTHAWGVA